MTNHITFTQFWAALRRRGALALCLAVCMLGLGLSATAQEPHHHHNQPPGRGHSAGLGTQGPGINPAAAVTGFYTDSKNVTHGFLRTPDGRITTFDAPGAGNETVSGFYGTPGGVMLGQGTLSVSINPAGAVTGFFFDNHNVAHSFLRAPHGKFTTFDAPSPYVGTGEGQGTEAANINPAGAIAGTTVDGNGAYHGFLRIPDGKITMFDAPAAGTGSGQGTFPEWASCLNSEGEITDTTLTQGGVTHGFMRAPDGTITEFDVTGAGTSSGQGT